MVLFYKTDTLGENSKAKEINMVLRNLFYIILFLSS